MALGFGERMETPDNLLSVSSRPQPPKTNWGFLHEVAEAVDRPVSPQRSSGSTGER